MKMNYLLLNELNNSPGSLSVNVRFLYVIEFYHRESAWSSCVKKHNDKNRIMTTGLPSEQKLKADCGSFSFFAAKAAQRLYILWCKIIGLNTAVLPTTVLEQHLAQPRRGHIPATDDRTA